VAKTTDKVTILIVQGGSFLALSPYTLKKPCKNTGQKTRLTESFSASLIVVY